MLTVNTLLVILAIIGAALAAFNVSLGRVHPGWLGLAIFMLATVIR